MPKRRLISRQKVVFDSAPMTITGIYESKETQPYQDKEITLYHFRNAVAEMVVTGTVQIDDAMGNAEIGDNVEITYLGEVKTSTGWDVKTFEIAVLTEGEDEDEEPTRPGS